MKVATSYPAPIAPSNFMPGYPGSKLDAYVPEWTTETVPYHVSPPPPVVKPIDDLYKELCMLDMSIAGIQADTKRFIDGHLAELHDVVDQIVAIHREAA